MPEIMFSKKGALNIRFWIIYILVQILFFGDCFRAFYPVLFFIFRGQPTIVPYIFTQHSPPPTSSPTIKKVSHGSGWSLTFLLFGAALLIPGAPLDFSVSNNSSVNRFVQCLATRLLFLNSNVPFTSFLALLLTILVTHT